jgi:hypothetical protein
MLMRRREEVPATVNRLRYLRNTHMQSRTGRMIMSQNKTAGEKRDKV